MLISDGPIQKLTQGFFIIFKKKFIKFFYFSINDDESECHSLVGTLDYLCPEVIMRKKHTEKVDIWCLGVLCYEMLAGQVPFGIGDHKTTLEKIKKVNYKFPNWFCKNSKELISKVSRKN